MTSEYRSNLCDIRVTLHSRIRGHVCVSLFGDKRRAVWLPLDVVELYREDDWPKGEHEITLPKPLAKRKGLLQ